MLRKGRNGFLLVVRLGCLGERGLNRALISTMSLNLQVESGLIDKAHHDGHARKALEETVELSKTVEKTIELLHELGLFHETLIIVTGGHGHTMSINGYPNRTDNILGKL